MLLVVAGFVLAPARPTAPIADLFPTVEPTAIVTGLIAGLFAFGGWHMVTYTAEETVEPERTIPRSLMVGVMIVTLCYIALNVIYLRVLPVNRVMSSTRIAADAAEALVGAWGGGLVAALVVLSTFGALNGIVLAGPRVYFAMARDSVLFPWVGELHRKTATPVRAILVQAVWASILVLTDTYRGLFTRVVYTEWIFFALLAVGILRLRRRADYKPAFRMPGASALVLIFVSACLVILVNQVLTDTANSLIGLLAVAAGLPAYYLTRTAHAARTSRAS